MAGEQVNPAMLQQLQSLVGGAMQTPKGQAMAQAIMAQMGGGGGGQGGAVPRASNGTDLPPEMYSDRGPGNGPPGQQLMGQHLGNKGSGMHDPGDPDMQPDRGPGNGPSGQQLMGQHLGRQGSSMHDPELPMTTEQELEQARQAMGNPGGGQPGGLNSAHGGPTPEEVQMLMSKPTDMNIANFNKLFGPGAAEQALGGSGQGPSYAEPEMDDDYDD